MQDHLSILQATLPVIGAGCTYGRLSCTISRYTDAQQLLSDFADFGGEGWFCTTESDNVLSFSPSSPIPAELVAGRGWPLCGEATNGESSMQIIREQQAWMLVHTKQGPSDSGKEILVQSEVMARNGAGKLTYETAWVSQDIDGIMEMRPEMCRFIGFCKKED